ncbi:MAG TPA: hypothetical protein VF519_01710 [Mycobacteriales bacterium]|jgi:hypothetical protein
MAARGCIALVTVAALSGCAERPATIAREDVGTVCHAQDHSENEFVLADFVAPRLYTPEWIRVRSRGQVAHGTARPDAPGIETVRLTSPEHLSGPVRSAPVSIDTRAVDEALGELDRGGVVVLVVPPESSFTHVVASLRSDGTVAFLGECVGTYGASLARLVAARHAADDGRSAADLFYALSSDAALRDQLRELDKPVLPTRPAWADIPAERRFIDPDGEVKPPAAVMATLAPHLVHLSFPAEWKAFDANLATFVPGVGWNAAVRLRIESRDPAVLSYVSLTAPLEVWVIPSRGGIQRPYARLATIPAAAFAGHEDVYLRAVGTAATLDELIDRGKRGETVFEAYTPE